MRQFTIGLLSAIAMTTAACGGSKASNATAVAATTPVPQTAAPGAPQSMPGQPPLNPNPNRTATPVATPIDFEKLIALVPDAPAGWTRSKPKGNQVSMGVVISMAEGDYEKGDSTIHLDITDTAFNQTYLTPLQLAMAAGYSERSKTGYTKAAPIAGSPGFEKWDSEARTAEVTTVVGNRIVVTAKGHNVDTADATRALVAAVDQGKIRDLK